MTRGETMRLLQLIILAYPNGKVQADEMTVDMWHRMLHDLGVEEARAAVERLVATQKFPPAIAEVREAVVNNWMDACGAPTAGEAWAKVVRAIGKYGYDQPRRAREDLGELVWAGVLMAGGWTHLCHSEDGLGVLGAQFERRYDAALKCERERLQIPENTRAQIRELARACGIHNGDEVNGMVRQALSDIGAQKPGGGWERRWEEATQDGAGIS